ncbi:helix-turn-helix domain-containing protein [Actinomadura formosensis]|uniref:helix-turn-helix domain-containing protein n=1 Tax=Actinomadura formosensis TaxID=60706 RepID=UPI003D93A242
MSTRSVGRRLQEWRKRRGITRRELSDLAGVSLSLIRKLEQGERQDTRLETLRKFAAALKIPTSELIGGSASDEVTGVDTEQWSAVREALHGRPRDEVAEEPTVEGVARSLASAMPLFSSDRYPDLAVLLPPLLRDAEALGAEGRQVRARLLQHTGWLLAQTRQFDAADLALRRALDDASDRLDAAATVNTLAWLLIRQGRFTETRALAAEWADDVEPRMSRATMAELSAWGWLLVRLSAAAVRNNRPGDAEDAIRLARTAAVAMGREYSPPGDFLRAFGPLTVAMKRTENAMVEDRPDKVLAMSQNIPVRDMRPTSNNRSRHLLDVAKARVQLREHAEAFDLLQNVRHDVPEWTANQRYARDIFRQIVSRRRTLTPDMREFADFMHLPV